MRTADFGLVDVLTAGALRAVHVDAQILVVDFDIDLFGLGQNGDGRGRGVNAAAGFGFRHALDANGPRLEFQLREDAVPVDRGRWPP